LSQNGIEHLILQVMLAELVLISFYTSAIYLYDKHIVC